VKRRRNITVAEQMWHWKSEGEFLSLKDQADQILAVQNVLNDIELPK